MALQDYYNTGDDSSLALYGIYWAAQTFTAGITYTITSVKLKLYRVGSPGNITVGIWDTAGDLPTGGADVSGVTNCDGITTNTTGEWVEFTFGAGIELTASSVYAIVVNGGTASANSIRWRYKLNGGYAGGRYCSSSNSGASWSGGTDDVMFETYSSGGTVYAEGTKTVTVGGGVSLTSDIMAITEGTKIVIAVAVVSLTSESYASQSGYPTPRPSAYDADKYWDETNGVWNTTRLTQPGNWVEYVLAISEEGEIYFRAVA